jgi:hypothetical protein
MHELEHKNFKLCPKVDKEVDQLQNSIAWTPQYSLSSIPPNHFIICSLNTRSFVMHAQEIAHDHKLINTTILCLQETKQTTQDHLKFLSMNFNYYFAMSIHRLLTCYAKTIPSLQMTTFATKHLESITIDLLHLGNQLRITNVYTTPRAPIQEFFNLIENVISTLP